MLKTVWLTEQQNTENGTAMLLGGFDGLHLGHRALLSCAQKSGFPVGLMTIVGGKEGKSLFTAAEREDIFKNCGVDFVFELPFEEIKNLSPKAFIDLLYQEFSPKLFVCGEDFRFGYQAKGTPETLKWDTRVRVEVCSLLEKYGKKISASEIKDALCKGEVSRANELLGEKYFLSGKVEKDRQVGRTLGFPTANIRYPQEKISLKKGVYETVSILNGKLYRGITNYGARPTFSDETVWTETYFDGFSGDLYGKELKIEFVRYLRDIEKFQDAESLKKQLQTDVRRIREND